ncbi:MAG: bifunctional UDP-N-acetylglucosamine diphosphorylase/glucosamine-1-phosphate N-acetyltransferase GlmU [Bdellovibrionaceae bacterium]|jgi:bifunctional UDP-N-acetylglucosamine pyrophosphorylase / glucosamine-1-phosphate N-acetyltransferase|nr:bifunctional UDP-N-acetylglucosamine diphosphorylase/glucosamine-1-phosphate N-acetyltransferase GlmU [Pseudobdellovibrionaceae bacterium]
MEQQKFSVIILAAGKGTRMKSSLPKILHPVAGKPMITRVIESVKQAGAEEIRVVLGYGEPLVRKVIEPLGVTCLKQTSQLGTADAVKAANVETLSGNVLILNGDHPLILKQDIKLMLDNFADSESDLQVTTVNMKNPKQFGRIVRHKGDIRAIVEAKDASSETLKIHEVNTGIYLVKSDVLKELLPKIKNHNTQKEYYLTDLVSLSLENHLKVCTSACKMSVAYGVNSQVELAKTSQYVFKRNAKTHMENGATIIDPSNTYIEDDVKIGESSVIFPGVFLRGSTLIGKYCVVEQNSFLNNMIVYDGVIIKTMSHLESSIIKSKAVIGPFARIRPETIIGEDARIGNFVELKKVNFGSKSKAGHLTYLGDAEIGEEVNIGCGTITCNYDVDKKKYKTVIGDRTFVGSDTQFVAPVTVGEDALIASGSTITKEVPDGGFAIARSRQITKQGYVPTKLREQTSALQNVETDVVGDKV